MATNPPPNNGPGCVVLAIGAAIVLIPVYFFFPGMQPVYWAVWRYAIVDLIVLIGRMIVIPSISVPGWAFTIGGLATAALLVFVIHEFNRNIRLVMYASFAFIGVLVALMFAIWVSNPAVVFLFQNYNNW
jgi:hypothetical protein